MNIAIIGGGLGGLALAQGLVRQGYAATVYERDTDASSRRQGYRISLNAMGWNALRELLPAERFARLERLEARHVGREFAFADAKMRPLLHVADPDGLARTICRPTLRELLAEEMPIVWGKRFASLREEADGVRVRFGDGSEVRADFVVACDGVGSEVRAFLPHAPRVEDLGIQTLGGVIPRTREWDEVLPLNQRGAVQYFGPHGQTIFVAFCEREDRSPMVLWALSCRGKIPRQIDAGFHPVLKRMVAETKADELIEHLSIRVARFDVPDATLWPSGRVTLLGDAAHAMPPQRGMGGNNALEDARLLASVMARPDRTALFEREMYTRAKIAVEQSEEAARLCHLRNPMGAALRNLVLRALSLLGTLRMHAHSTWTKLLPS